MPLTSPDNLFFPDHNSGSDLTQHLQDLAEDIQDVFTASSTWNSWTPLWDTPANGGSNGGFTAYGSGGGAYGHYIRSRPGSGALIYGEFRFVLGSGVTVQTTGGVIFVLRLPVTAYLWGGVSAQNCMVGRWTLRDDSMSPIGSMCGSLGTYSGSDGLSCHFTDAAENSSPFESAYRIDSTDPITWAASDQLTGHLLYRAA